MSAEDAEARLNTLTDVITPWAVRVAATLRLSDLLASGATTLDDLATLAGADRDALGRLLRYLVCRGIYAETSPEVYALTELSRLLQSGHPAGRRAWLDMDGVGGRNDRTFADLLASVRTGRPAYAAVHGRPFWDDLAADPELARSFDALMAGHASWFGLVVTAFDWSRATHVVDVGGGCGTLLGEVLRAQPQLRGTLVDLPGTTATAPATFAEAGVADRVEVVAGSFFEPLPPDGDLYVLSNVLHDWPDDAAVRILSRCAEAAGPDGRILIIERLSAGPGDPETTTRMDLRMLVLVGGRERTLDAFGGLASAAGLALTPVGTTRSGHTLMECGVLPTGSVGEPEPAAPTALPADQGPGR
jgi:O-methyltransferase domain